MQENEESLSAIRGQKEGRPDWRWVGRDFPMIFRKSRTDRWELTVADYWAIIAAKNASFTGHFGRSGIGVGKAPEVRHPHPRLGRRRSVSQMGFGAVAIPP